MPIISSMLNGINYTLSETTQSNIFTNMCPIVEQIGCTEMDFFLNATLKILSIAVNVQSDKKILSSEDAADPQMLSLVRACMHNANTALQMINNNLLLLAGPNFNIQQTPNLSSITNCALYADQNNINLNVRFSSMSQKLCDNLKSLMKSQFASCIEENSALNIIQIIVALGTLLVICAYACACLLDAGKALKRKINALRAHSICTQHRTTATRAEAENDINRARTNEVELTEAGPVNAAIIDVPNGEPATEMRTCR